MKKIVALVLCLALALSLCTVAFAASGKDYSLVKMTGGVAGAATDMDGDDEISVTAASKSTTTKDDETTVTYKPAVYELTINASTTEYYECHKDVATQKLVKGNTVVYLIEAASWTKPSATETATKFSYDEDTVVCGQPQQDAYLIDGSYYAMTGNNWALLDGKFVTYGDKITKDTAKGLLQHAFAKDGDAKVTYDAKGVPTSIVCGNKNCSATSFSVVKAAGIPDTYSESDYQKLDGWNKQNDDTQYYILTKTAGTTGSNDKTVESAKTFDAGIALYAGMALASVAGSAVVIGKKKEF